MQTIELKIDNYFNELNISKDIKNNYERKIDFYLKLLEMFYFDTSFQMIKDGIVFNKEMEIKDNCYKLCSISASIGFNNLYRYSYKIIKAINNKKSIYLIFKKLEGEYYRILSIIKDLYEEKNRKE